MITYMKKSFAFFGFLMLALLMGAHAQDFSFERDAVIDRLKADVLTLASDEFEGRESGTPGEAKTVEYIKQRMVEAGLEPLFSQNSFFQEFLFYSGVRFGQDNRFEVNGKSLKVNDDYQPLPLTFNGAVQGEFVSVGHGFLDLQNNIDPYKGLKKLKGKVFVMEYYLPVNIDKQTKLTQTEINQARIATAIDKGAAAVIFVNTQANREDPSIRLPRRLEKEGIPVLYVKKHASKELTNPKSNRINLSVQLEEFNQQGINVGGYINNDAPLTVVIGAHHDHLGIRISNTGKQGTVDIYNGADDNASGVAGVLELARYLKLHGQRTYNYIFLTFAAEEVGLRGSAHFANSDAYDISKINYMFNLDMIGRSEEKKLTLIGVGTSPEWEPLIQKKNNDMLVIRTSPGGVGGSDHSSFYVKDIPVLFFFTGTHEDYHKTTDTFEKINFDGMTDILQLARDMVLELEQMDRVAFTKTEQQPSRRRTAGVTLGIMPDMGYDGNGLRIQKVMEGVGKKYGMQDGDVVLKMGDQEVRDIETYTDALGKFKKGDKVVVLVKRGNEQVEVSIEF